MERSDHQTENARCRETAQERISMSGVLACHFAVMAPDEKPELDRGWFFRRRFSFPQFPPLAPQGKRKRETANLWRLVYGEPNPTLTGLVDPYPCFFSSSGFGR